MKRKFLTLIAAVAAAMALALSAGAEAATPETAGSLTPLMPMFDTADTGIAEYSGDIVQEDAATYDASYNTNEDVAANERDVYNYLTGTMGMNSAAASGVMASMYRESRFYVDITNDYGTAYGLCQWYGDRWTNLQNYCNNNGLDWHTLYGQMRFLEYELNSLSSLRSYMYGISNDANGAYHAGYEWCRVYELGGNTSDTTRCDSRGTLARDTFWPKYQNGSTGGYTGWRSENGRDYWYENGVKQGTTGRGKEIYDASSDAWYWLDAVDGGAKAVNKDVYQESDGGKWVRYDENGHMIKGENCQNGNWYYFEPVTGAMIHGPWTLPDGRKVYYDLTTGIMQYGNVSINGSLYYFDPVYGTMKSGALTNFWVTDGNGKSFWYESWVRQGWQPSNANYRGKEIYDPDSDAWYWLDAVQGGAMTVSKDVYQESAAGQWADKPDGTGKWVRYDENGHMVKGWQTTDKGTYYFDLITGAMAKGAGDIDGVPCAFDEYTGIALDGQWLTIKGADFWYEKGVRQGLDGRGKEIYDPASDAWYWLDSVDQGKKATSKDVYQESEAGQWADRADGTGKWVRYDAQGHMIKGWSADKRYYFDPIYGTMAKGDAVIDGRTYHFDKNTGIRQ